MAAPYPGSVAAPSPRPGEPSPRTGPARRVLVVDDEPMVREVATAYLEREGFVVSEAADGPAALARVTADPPDLVVLDVMLPELDGFSVLTRIRRTSDVPVVLLTARAEEADRVLGLELGADDYVVKPFSPRELAARVRSVLRRTLDTPRPGDPRSGTRTAGPGPGAERLTFEGLAIDPVSREVHVDGTPVELTPKEFDLLAFLARSPRQVFSRAQILEQVWDSSPDWQDPSTVTVHVRRVRQKIESEPESPRWIHTVWGVGYRFEP